MTNGVTRMFIVNTMSNFKSTNTFNNSRNRLDYKTYFSVILVYN